MVKIQGSIIRDKYIQEHTDTVFDATYKGRQIYITTEHGLGLPRETGLNRYCIDVTHSTGMKEVDTYEDLETMQEAIEYALTGSQLLNVKD